MWELFQAGGPFMWPLALCSIVAIVIIRYIRKPDVTALFAAP